MSDVISFLTFLSSAHLSASSVSMAFLNILNLLFILSLIWLLIHGENTLLSSTEEYILRTEPTIVTAHIFYACQGSRAGERNAQHAGHAEWFCLSPVSLGGSTYFLWKRCDVFQQTKNNFYLTCQFFENRRSMRMLPLFLPYDRSDRTFYSQTKVNSKTSKVIASRCYTWSLGIEKSRSRQGSVIQMENSSKFSA